MPTAKHGAKREDVDTGSAGRPTQRMPTFKVIEPEPVIERGRPAGLKKTKRQR
jgi:hypothetical protein